MVLFVAVVLVCAVLGAARFISMKNIVREIVEVTVLSDKCKQGGGDEYWECVCSGDNFVGIKDYAYRDPGLDKEECQQYLSYYYLNDLLMEER